MVNISCSLLHRYPESIYASFLCILCVTLYQTSFCLAILLVCSYPSPPPSPIHTLLSYRFDPTPPTAFLIFFHFLLSFSIPPPLLYNSACDAFWLDCFSWGGGEDEDEAAQVMITL